MTECPHCGRPLPKTPFTGIGWREVILNVKDKQRTRICNDCYLEWRKTHPKQPFKLNIKFINNLISVCILLTLVYALVTFIGYGINNWMGFLGGPGLVVIVVFIFLNLAYGLINKKIEFRPPLKTETKKYDYNFPNITTTPNPFQQHKNIIPQTLDYIECDLCHRETLKDDLFTHPEGFKICKDCISKQ